MIVFLDFETRSEAQLKSCGQWEYAADPSTEILCMAYSIDGSEPSIWKLGEEFPEALRCVEDPSTEIHAHNAAFEIAIWKNVGEQRLGWPVVRDDQWHCTAARAAAFSLPRSLKDAGKSLGTEAKKDDKGHRVMLQLCRPTTAWKKQNAAR